MHWQEGIPSRVDVEALGSDVSRSKSQYFARRLSRFLIWTFRLNRPSLLATEFLQSANPVARIRTRYGELLCRGGHGRLTWRAKTFFTEEPKTIEWLDTIESTDTYWDVGANVGLYAIYAAKFRKCKTIAFEPEAQNYALLIDNILMNDVRDGIMASSVPLSDVSGMGRFFFRYLTKGGAYNLFRPGLLSEGPVPQSIAAATAATDTSSSFSQLVYGTTIDHLVFDWGLPPPTHLKIDVDGTEPNIIAGGEKTLARPELRSILIEVNRNSPTDLALVDNLKNRGFRVTDETSVWTSRPRDQTYTLPCVNMIFHRED